MKLARILSGVLCIMIVFGLSVAPARSQSQAQPAPLGMVVQSSGGSIGNAAATEGSTVYSGDYLSTSNNGSLSVRMGGLSLELTGSSGAHVYRAPYGAVVELNHGTVIYRTPGTQENLVIVASDIRATPELSTPDFGRVTIVDSCNVIVVSQQGQAKVQAGSESHTVEEGKAYRVLAMNELSYREYLSPDADDYHKHHEHKPCAPLLFTKGSPIAPAQSRFMIVTAALVGGATAFGVYKAIESPARP
jgi:hypothetical protein